MNEGTPRTEVELRCFCSRTPLLAKAGQDSTGKPFIHLRVYKAKKLYAEMVATSGPVRIRCRECLRWHLIAIRENVKMEPTELPDRIPVA